MADEGLHVPTDALVDILLRLPTSARRRFRLVCKLWRDAIDEHTPERQVRTKILAFIGRWRSSRAVVFDDKDGRRRREWTYPRSHQVVHMVGTCNGLICLHHDAALTVANPVTGEALPLPPLPAAWGLPGGTHAFGYHPTTGRYKVVHVPSRHYRRQDVVQVLTVGDPAWREVASPAKGGGYNPLCGVVGVDGSVYWFTSRADRVAALDLKDERLASFPGPPGVAGTGKASWRLTSVHARLGVAVPRHESAGLRVEVWVLDGGGGGGGEERPRWSRRYSLFEHGRILMRPHLTHGEYVLSTSWDGRRLYRRKVGGRTDADDAVATPTPPWKGAELLTSELPGDGLVIFAYAETREPLPSTRG